MESYPPTFNINLLHWKHKKFALVDVWFPVEIKGGLFLSFSYAVAPAVFLAFKFENAVLAFWVARVVSSIAFS